MTQTIVDIAAALVIVAITGAGIAAGCLWWHARRGRR